MANNQKNRYKAPNAFIYRIGRIFMGPYYRLRYRFSVTRDAQVQALQRPFVVVCNHASLLDFALLMLSFKQRLHMVVASTFMHTPVLGTILRWLRTIPKLQMMADPVCIRQMLTTAKNGGSIGIFPHGQVSYDGREMAMPKGTGKLIKRMGVPVVRMLIHGASMSRPKWAQYPRRNRVTAHIDVLLSAAQIETMSAEEIDLAVECGLCFNDIAFAQEHGLHYRGRHIAQGLEKLGYQCPRCGALYTTVTEGDTIRCTRCHNAGRLDESGGLHPLREGDMMPADAIAWTALERKRAYEALREGPLEERAKLLVAGMGSARFLPCGEGVFSVSEQCVRFVGTKSGQPFEMQLPSSVVPGIPFSWDQSYWEVPNAAEYLRIVPENPRAILRLVLALEGIHGRLMEEEAQA